MVSNKTTEYLLRLDPKIHRRIKAAAALAGKSMKDFILEAVEKEIERRSESECNS